MRKLILKMHVSIDGYVRAADGDVMDWVFRSFDDELKQWEVESLWRASAHIMGRKVYDEMAAYWPTSTEPYAPPMNEIPKIVFSRSITRAEWVNTQISNGDLEEEVKRLKQEDGKHILAHGGAEFAQALSARKLIDEYHLIVHPVALAGGLPLFTEVVNLKLASARIFPAGAALMIYERQAA